MFISYYILAVRDNICVGEKVYYDKATAIKNIVNVVTNVFGDSEGDVIRSHNTDIYFSEFCVFKHRTGDIIFLEQAKDTVIDIHTYIGCIVRYVNMY